MIENPSPAQPQTPALAKSDQNLIWIDCEMTGLDPEVERLIEIAVVATDPSLTVRVDGPSVVIHQSLELLQAMDHWNTKTHTRTGLYDKVLSSSITEEQAQEMVLEFIEQYAPKSASPMCGNTIGQDRRFLVKYMPKLEGYFHYRNIDVTSFKELARRWRPAIADGFKKRQVHTAMADVHESIDELLYYREHFIRLD